MAIRFQCSSCSQPIEIDDVWSSKLVACPYCQNTVTAPETSTLADLSATPTARSLSSDFSSTVLVPKKQSRLGIVSLVLACLALSMMIGFAWTVAQHNEQLQEIDQQIKSVIAQGGNQFAASQQIAADLMKSDPSGALPMWLVLIFFLFFGTGLTCLAATTCAIIAIRNPASRVQSSIALGLCSVIIIPFSFALFFS